MIIAKIEDYRKQCEAQLPRSCTTISAAARSHPAREYCGATGHVATPTRGNWRIRGARHAGNPERGAQRRDDFDRM